MSLPVLAAETAPTVLVVDDDAGLRTEIIDYMAQNGFAARGVGAGPAMDRMLAAERIDLVVLDLMLPGEDGLSICRRLRESGGPPVIMLSAMGHEVDRIVGLELGADDYLPKPCNPRELLARVRAVLRRRDGPEPDGGPPRPRIYGFLGYTVDVNRRRVRGPDGAAIVLTGGEFALLSVFLGNPQRILSRERLLELARGSDADVFDRAVDVQISRLRRKLGGGDAELIRTYRGAGYMFDVKVGRL